MQYFKLNYLHNIFYKYTLHHVVHVVVETSYIG